jgi:transcriptional regulator with XRE-family HTH domain
MTLRNVLARNLKELRLERGFSQEAFADLAGIDRTYVSAIERARYAVSLDMLEKLSDALKVEPWTLLKS